MRSRVGTGVAVFALAAMVCGGSAFSACPLKEYTVTGTALGADGSPVAGATVEAEWDEKQAGVAQTRTKSGADGRFTLTIQFDTYTSKSFGGTERCDAELAEVRVKARAQGGLDSRQRAVALSAEPPDIALELD